MEIKMKKLFIILFLFAGGCSTQQVQKEKIDFDKPNNESDTVYDFSHGIVGYNFEKIVSEDGEISFKYQISNNGKEVDLGIVFLIDGLPQKIKIDREEVLMFTKHFNSMESEEIEVKLNVDSELYPQNSNLNAIAIINPTMKIETPQQYGVNHYASFSPTMKVELGQGQKSDIVRKHEEGLVFMDLAEEDKAQYQHHGENMLNTEVYIEVAPKVQEGVDTIKKQESIPIKILGAPGFYRVIIAEDNILSDLFVAEVKSGKKSELEIKRDFENVQNVYFVVIPIDEQDTHSYVMPGQSSKWVLE